MSVDLEAFGRDYRFTAERPDIAPLIAEVRALRAEREALQRFKDFVHRRLDTAGVPTHPDGPHSKEGCRIGDRLDLVVGERDALTFERDEARDWVLKYRTERDALRAKNKALAQQFLDADGYVVELRARCAELERLASEQSTAAAEHR